MTEEQYYKLKEDYIEHILEYVREEGGLFPHLSILADIKEPSPEEENKPALIHIPIDEQYMESEENKDEFVYDILPVVFKKLKKDFTPTAIAWASEAWMRIVDKNFDVSKQNWKEIPIKKEVIIITIESEFENISHLYEIKRKGKQINSEGTLIDAIQLEKLDEEFKGASKVEGRFSGLFKKFKD